MPNPRIQEIEMCLHNDDLNRASQRLMDFGREFNLPKEVIDQLKDLRIKYNEAKELGSQSVVDLGLKAEMLKTFDQLVAIDPQIKATEREKGEVVCETKGIGVRFKSRLHNFEFKPLDLKLAVGAIVGLVGENGNGKTTLLRMICGELQPSFGGVEFYFDGQKEGDWRKIKERVAFIPQRVPRWFGDAEQNLSFLASNKGFVGEENLEQLDFYIHRLGLTSFRELKWGQLSSGYKLRFEIARALIWEPHVIILDEPLANLDIQAQALLLQDLRNLADSITRPVSIILSSQQLHEVETIADHVIFLKNGNAVYNGPLDGMKTMSSAATYEVSGSFDYNELATSLASFDEVKIEKGAGGFTVDIPLECDSTAFLQHLLKNDLKVDYFRNITGSTKKLFNDKY